ncbi:hypothetical protein Hanom_Chr09g00790511 [Helianthus anomalus]
MSQVNEKVPEVKDATTTGDEGCPTCEYYEEGSQPNGVEISDKEKKRTQGSYMTMLHTTTFEWI